MLPQFHPKVRLFYLKLSDKKLQLTAGAKMMVFSDGVSILLKPIPEPDISEFQNLMDSAASWASEVGITEDDITAAIKTVRSRRKATT